MSYFQTILTRRTRIIIMVCLIVIFFIVSPLLILYTAGYRYDWKQNQIKQMGSLSIDIKPNDAQIYLNDVLINNKIPVRLNNLTPGPYHLQLARSSYKDWNKDIIIESSKTTYIKDITLFKNSSPIKILPNFSKNIIGVYPSPDGLFLLILTDDNNVFEISNYDTRTAKLSSLIRIPDKQKPLISWSPYANFIAIILNNGKQHSIQLINVNNLNINKTYLLAQSVTDFQWSKNLSLPTLFLNIDNSIVQFDAFNTSTIFNFNTNTPDIWYIDSVNQLTTYKAADNIIKQGNIQYYFVEGIDNIIDANNSRMIYQFNNETKVLTFNDKKISEIKSLASPNLFYNQTTNEWLAWSPWELWTIYDNGAAELLMRTSEKIVNVNPLDEFGVLLLSSENKMTSFNPGYYVSNELSNNNIIKISTADINNRQIYFWGKVNQEIGVFKLEY